MKKTAAIPSSLGLLSTFATAVLSLGFLYSSWGQAVSHIAYDAMFGLRGAEAPTGDVIVVAIDEPAFAEINLQWPWPRSFHAKLVDQLFAAGARAVALDILFAEPSLAEEDQALAAAIDRHRNVVLVSEITRSEDLAMGYRDAVTITIPDSIVDYAKKETLVGFAQMQLDNDGFVRRLSMSQEGEDAFSLLATEAFRPSAEKKTGAKERWINFRGPARTIPTVSYYRALDPATYLPPGYFQDKLVFVGLSTASEATVEGQTADHFPTPLSRSVGGHMAGVEIHANAAENFLADDFIEPVDSGFVFWTCFVLSILLGLLFIRYHPLTIGLALFTVSTGAAVFLPYSLFVSQTRYFPFSHLVIPFVCQYVLSIVLHFWFTWKERSFINQAFSTYLAPSLVQQLLDQPERLELGGEDVEGTVLFLDLAGFTTLSEKLSPKELIEMVNRNLGGFAEIILDNDGMIDKYIGDCIMAVWGVPLPQAGHAEKACAATLEMLNNLDRLAADEMERSGVQLSIRIGVNSGRMVAGNVGGGKQFNYTVLGNEVNLAARLEGINKYYGTKIIISESTAKDVKEIFELREIDIVRVVGKKQPTSIFELCSKRGELSEAKQKLNNAFANGRRLYSEQKWQEAVEAFADALRIDANDGPSKVYKERCEQFIQQPPAGDWDGVYQMSSK